MKFKFTVPGTSGIVFPWLPPLIGIPLQAMRDLSKLSVKLQRYISGTAKPIQSTRSSPSPSNPGEAPDDLTRWLPFEGEWSRDPWSCRVVVMKLLVLQRLVLTRFWPQPHALPPPPAEPLALAVCECSHVDLLPAILNISCYWITCDGHWEMEILWVLYRSVGNLWWRVAAGGGTMTVQALSQRVRHKCHSEYHAEWAFEQAPIAWHWREWFRFCEQVCIT